MSGNYEAWNDAFIREYFPEGNVGRLAWLPVDDDEIRALAATYGLVPADTAVEQFVAVVRATLATKGGSFMKLTAGINGWRRVRDTPPYVAGLAFCVLAASRMAGDVAAGIASHNYYAQLNRLIARDDGARQPPGFDQVGDAWRDLAKWLDEDCAGRRGLSTFRTSENAGKHVGYPMSQALLRAADRRRLPDFFHSTGLEPESDIHPQRLFHLLRAWAALPSCGLTRRGRSAIAGAEDIDLHEIAETVLRELRAWDGELRDARGRRRAPIHLLVIPRRRGTSIRLLARRPDGFPEGPWAVGASPQRLVLEPHPTADGWYAPLETSVSSVLLQNGLRLAHGDAALTFEPAPAIPCREAAPEIGGYISQHQATMFEPHIALVRRSLMPQLKEYASRYTDARPDARLSPPGFPADWALTTEFRFTARPEAAPPDFARLAPRLIATTSFSGGLELSPGLYLGGGEPDVNIATEEGSALVPQLDGIAQPLKGGALTLHLSDMNLEPGEHELKADITRRFSTAETLGDTDPPGAGSLGFKLSRHTGYRPHSTLAEPLEDPAPSGCVYLSGAVARAAHADLPLPDRRPLLVRAGGHRYVVLGASGELHNALPTVPEWLCSLGLGHTFQFIELRPSFEPAWLLRESSAFAKEVVPLHADPPPPAVDCAPPAAWAAAVDQWHGAAVPAAVEHAWLGYVQAAAATSTGHEA